MLQKLQQQNFRPGFLLCDMFLQGCFSGQAALGLRNSLPQQHQLMLLQQGVQNQEVIKELACASESGNCLALAYKCYIIQSMSSSLSVFWEAKSFAYWYLSLHFHYFPIQLVNTLIIESVTLLRQYFILQEEWAFLGLKRLSYWTVRGSILSDF